MFGWKSLGVSSEATGSKNLFFPTSDFLCNPYFTVACVYLLFAANAATLRAKTGSARCAAPQDLTLLADYSGTPDLTEIDGSPILACA
jgi:hypothetical protein